MDLYVWEHGLGNVFLDPAPDLGTLHRDGLGLDPGTAGKSSVLPFSATKLGTASPPR